MRLYQVGEVRSLRRLQIFARGGIEEISGNCGVRDTLAYELAKRGTDVRIDGIDLGNRYIQHGSLDALYDHYGLSGNKIAQYVLEVCQNEN